MDEKKKRLSFFQLHGVPKRTTNGLLLFAVSWAAIWALLHFLYQQQYAYSDSLVSATADNCHVVDGLAQSRKLAGLDRFQYGCHPLNF